MIVTLLLIPPVLEIGAMCWTRSLLAATLVLCFCQLAQAQSEDPFGGELGEDAVDPFGGEIEKGGNPFAAPRESSIAKKARKQHDAGADPFAPANNVHKRNEAGADPFAPAKNAHKRNDAGADPFAPANNAHKRNDAGANPFAPANNAHKRNGAGADPFAPAKNAHKRNDAGANPFAAAKTQPTESNNPFDRPPTVMEKAGHRRQSIHARPMNHGMPAGEVTVFRSDNVAEKRIRSALDGNSTSINFVQTPLEEVMQTLSDQHDIPILVDRRSLEETGLDVDVPISISLKGVSLRSAMRLMLRPLNLTYAIGNEVLIVTTAEAVPQYQTLRMYRLPAALDGKSDAIVDVLTKTVRPGSWQASGGEGSVSAVDNVLVVSVGEDVHDDVEQFLDRLTQAFSGSPGR